MPESNKIKQDEVMVDLDTSGPDTEVSLPEETVKETEKVETTEPEKVETTEPEKVETKDDEKLEDYSKGVQARIAKLTQIGRAHV